MTEGCLDDNTLAAYFDGALGADEVRRADSHIDSCAACRGDLSALAAVGSRSDEAGGDAALLGELLPGQPIGRYVVVREHARGGMGVVVVAHDPELARDVAIKVLRPELSTQLAADHVRQEARAMAKLSHPNVVSLHDVGEHAGRLFLAMELVEGVTLRAWLAARPRSWREILGTCIRAGRGLAAAHHAGLVHRDVKPDNILCGPADRVRVTDFGLARGDGVARLGAGTGLVGTPSYMAPEVWRREPATARSDQWSFCVTVHEAVCGALPFTGRTAHDLAAAIARGAPPLARPGIPARVTRAIARGLEVDPARRFASMDALLDELEPVGKAPRRAALATAGIGAIALAVVGVANLRRDRTEPCEMSPALLAGAWDAGRQAAIAAAFGAIRPTHGPQTAGKLGAIVATYGGRWLAARHEACVATRVRGDQSEAVLDARIRCLDRRHAELARLTLAFADHPTAAQVDGAVEASLALDPVEACTATGVATELPLPADPARAAQIITLDLEIAATRAGLLVHQLAATRLQVASLVERAAALGHPPTTARAAHLRSMLARFDVDQDAGERQMFDAIATTGAASDDLATADIWVELVAFLAQERGDAALALRLVPAADGAIRRAGSPRTLRAHFEQSRGMALVNGGRLADARPILEQAIRDTDSPLDVANLESMLCAVEFREGHMKPAIDRCRDSVARIEAVLGASHPGVAFALIGLSSVLLDAGDDAGARATIERALPILAHNVGEHHVSYALALNNLGMVAVHAGDATAARQDFLAALATLEALHHADVFKTLGNLGNLERDAGDPKAARAYTERALGFAETTYGKTSEQVGIALQSLAAVEIDDGHLDRGEAAYRRSLAIAEQLFGDKHPRVATALDGLAFVLTARNDCAHAIPFEIRAVAVNETVYGPSHPTVAETLTSLANCQRTLGDRAAIATAERAIAIHDRFPTERPFEPAFTRWVLARAVAELGHDRTRGVALAREARALYARATEPEAKPAITEIDRWLASH